MQYIEKVKPDFYEEDIKDLRNELQQANNEDKKNYWDKYNSTKKRKLREYMLEKEQNEVCGYCECRIDLNSSHIEHIEPKSNNYDLLTFEYDNLIVSCNGTCFSSTLTPDTCGHKKDSTFNKKLFLNPTTETKIEKHFKYKEDGDIKESNRKNKKAKYTLKLLNLTENETLKEQRVIVKQAFIRSVKSNSEKTKRSIKEITEILLSRKNTPFLSFLLYHYKKEPN